MLLIRQRQENRVDGRCQASFSFPFRVHNNNERTHPRSNYGHGRVRGQVFCSIRRPSRPNWQAPGTRHPSLAVSEAEGGSGRQPLYHRLPMPESASSYLSPFRSGTALACFLLVAALGLIADLSTKAAAWGYLVDSVEVHPTGDILLFRNNLADDNGTGEAVYDVVVIPRGLELTAVANQGAAMGLGQGRKTLFIVVSVAAVGVLFYFFAHSNGRRLYQV